MTWLNPARWLLYLAAIGALLLALHRLDASRQQIGYDRAQAEYTAQALAAEQAARARESALQTAKQKLDTDYAKHKRDSAIAAAAADAELDRLRGVLANRGDSGADTAATSGTDDPRDSIIGECARTVVALDAGYQRLAAKTSALQDYASNVCVAPQ